ncbi:hypothetical protein L4174_022405 [Photobacterium sp. CCB-ST2H9]|uniref:hypothetical protein n=1 Tax=Photobacterium sp. CCB-ST2H9 TaxID=2912855 RepID=UPI0020067226|nr:hypothetical protein [Photobacterium sp. CCB-ST2H9]UTM59452.1 hypothetical protein L4174_022405 [Photobacterium sp. CCB-ST2H9]
MEQQINNYSAGKTTSHKNSLATDFASSSVSKKETSQSSISFAQDRDSSRKAFLSSASYLLEKVHAANILEMQQWLLHHPSLPGLHKSQPKRFH